MRVRSTKCNHCKSQEHKTHSRETESCDRELKSLLVNTLWAKLEKGMGESYSSLFYSSNFSVSLKLSQNLVFSKLRQVNNYRLER